MVRSSLALALLASACGRQHYAFQDGGHSGLEAGGLDARPTEDASLDGAAPDAAGSDAPGDAALGDAGSDAGQACGVAVLTWVPDIEIAFDTCTGSASLTPPCVPAGTLAVLIPIELPRGQQLNSRTSAGFIASNLDTSRGCDAGLLMSACGDNWNSAYYPHAAVVVAATDGTCGTGTVRFVP